MQRRLWSPILIVAAVLSGCSGTPKQDTLDDLGELDIKIDTESSIMGGRDKAMDNYWEFMAGTNDDAQKVEAMRRLADLEMERSEDRFQKQLEVIGSGKEGIGADLDTLRDITYRRAIKLYEDALTLAAGKPPHSIGLLYQLSKAYEQAGHPEKALVALDRLLVLNSRAENLDELQFRRGELLFGLRRFDVAESAYAQVVVIGPTSRYFEKAMAQRGWSMFKQEKFEGSLNVFFDLVDRKLKPTVGFANIKLKRGDRELLDDVFRVVTLSFSELNGTAGIKSFFEGYGHRDYELRVYEDLAKFYLKQNRVRDAASAYHAVAKAYPMHERAFEFDLKAINTYTAAGFSSVLMDEKKAYIKRYRVNGPYWTRFEEQEDTILAKLKKALLKNSEDVVRHAHSEAQKHKSMVAYQTAFLAYRQHLKWFRQTKKSHRLNFLYAELLFESGNYERAAKEFEKTAYQYLRFGKDAEAGYAALLAFTEAEKHATGKQKETWSRLAVGSALRFGKTFPDDKRSAEVLTKAAQDMFALKKFAQAAVAARQILEISGVTKPSIRRTAWKIIARAEFEKGDYTRAEVAYKVALSLLSKDNIADRKSLKDGLAAAVYKQGEYMKSKGNLQGAIAQFARVKLVSPDSAIIVSAEFDIAVSLLEAKNWKGAISKFTDFRHQNPENPLTKKVSGNLIKAYTELKQPLKAAKELELFAAMLSNPDDKREAIWQAAEIYEKSGSQDMIVTAFKRYIGLFPEPLERATEARQKLAAIYGKGGQPEQRRYWLKEIMRRDEAAGSGSTARTRFLAAKAAFELAEPTLKSYQQVKLVRPLKVNLKRKKQKLKEAVDAYTIAADYGIAEVTTASVYWLAEIYDEFGRALMGSERPPGLSEEELEQYDILLEEQAYPFEDKSIDIHVSNVGRIAEGTYDEWVKKSFSRLKKLNPIRYDKSERTERFASHIR